MRSLLRVAAAYGVAAICTTLLAWTPNAGDPRPAAVGDAAAREAGDFSHAKHVPQIWKDPDEPEQARDCRGCHAFPDGGGPDAPQQTCNACHAGDANLDLAPSDAGWDKDMRNARTPLSRSFRHDKHDALACRHCHAVEDPLADMPAHLPIPTSSRSCEACHGADDQGAPKATAADIDDWQYVVPRPAAGTYTPTSTVASFAGNGTGINDGRLAVQTDRPFEHKDHLAAEFLDGAKAGRESQCVVCHNEVRGADHASAGLKTVDEEGCGTCHFGANGVLEADSVLQTRPSPSVATFAHADHYGFRTDGRSDAAAPAAYDRIGASDEQTSCGACHAYRPTAADPARNEPRRDFPFGATGPHAYGGCLECHTADDWATAPSLHASSADDPPPLGWDRESDDGARACTACHTFGVGTMAENRATTSVSRIDLEAFGFLGNAHPHVTKSPTAGATVDCSACHLAEDEATLRSRITARPFRHDVHLSPPGSVDDETASNECLTCHTQARSATTPAELVVPAGSGDPAMDLHFRLGALDAPDAANAEDGCAACHRSTAVLTTPEQPQPTERSVVLFAHADHVGNSCSECHERVAEPATSSPSMTTLPVAQCSKCHDHTAENAAHTGRISGTEVSSCARCHGSEPQRGIPRRRADPEHRSDPSYQVQLQVFAGFKGAQYHPTPSDEKYGTCSECHVLDVESPIPVDERLTHVRAAASANYHGTGSDNMGRDQNCYGCHWNNPGKSGRYLSSFPGRTLAETDSVRARLGAMMQGFPGQNAPR